jgi:predicted Zn-dependent protease
MAGMLAGMLILAAGGGDAGVATIAATQAAAAESQLAHSRLHEIEADRAGMDTLIRAGMEPLAMARMFETMLDAKRFSGRNFPEFLLTHPLTERRVSDAKTRARNYTVKAQEKSLDYFLMQARVKMHFAHSPGEAIAIFKAEMANTLDPVEHNANRYGLVLAYTESRQFDVAQQQLDKLLQQDNLKLIYQLAQADIYSRSGQHERAAHYLENMLMITPNSHAVTMALAQSYLQLGYAKQAANLLEQHSRIKPNNPALWYELAEAKGLAGDILGVHTARGEYFLLTGILDEAGRQLNYALNIARGDFMETAKLEQRLRYLEELRNIKL